MTYTGLISRPTRLCTYFEPAERYAAENGGIRSPESAAAVRLFIFYVSELLGQIEPLLDDRKALAYVLATPNALVTYPVACCRLVELLGLLSFEVDGDLLERVNIALVRLCSDHPGCARPPADQFAVSLIPSTVALARRDPEAASAYLRAVSGWLLDRYDPLHNGLGLASLEEDEETTSERLVGNTLGSSQLERRRPSYIATVLLDLLVALGFEELYEAVRHNIDALQIIPIITAADETNADWRRGGANVFPHPRVDYSAWEDSRPDHHSRTGPASPRDTALLTAVCRSRHYPQAIELLVHL